MKVHLKSIADTGNKNLIENIFITPHSTVSDFISIIKNQEEFNDWNSRYAQLGDNIELVWNGKILDNKELVVNYGIKEGDIIIAQPQGTASRVAGGAKHHKRKMRKKTNKKRGISKSRNRKSSNRKNSKRNTRKRNTRKRNTRKRNTRNRN